MNIKGFWNYFTQVSTIDLGSGQPLNRIRETWTKLEKPILKKKLQNKDWEIYYHYFEKFFIEKEYASKDDLIKSPKFQEYIEICEQFFPLSTLFENVVRPDVGKKAGQHKIMLEGSLHMVASAVNFPTFDVYEIKQFVLGQQTFLALSLNIPIGTMYDYNIILLDVTVPDKIKAIALEVSDPTLKSYLNDYNGDGLLDFMPAVEMGDSIQYLYTIKNDSVLLDTSRYVRLCCCPAYTWYSICYYSFILKSESNWK
jgi:hypothetical protein